MGKNDVESRKLGARDQMVEFEEKAYHVKTDWRPVDGAKTFFAYAVAEDEVATNGVYPAVMLEAFHDGDGMWDVIGVTGPELVDDAGGCYAVLSWSEKDGVTR